MDDLLSSYGKLYRLSGISQQKMVATFSAEPFAPAENNRIASDFVHYITIFEQGYMLGRPIQYKNEDTTLQEQINLFVEENNEAAHNVLIKTDLSIYGRAYELLTVEPVSYTHLTLPTN